MSKDSFDNDIKSQLRKRLEQLTLEHRDLDEVIDQLAQGTNIDILKLQRLKKRKLGIKDEIRIINQKLLPDIIA
ncbi:MAG: YdcH family protein [Candidatus Puniceispirillales bacterium]|nr:DUF465 domain-containing protein [Pseudomonadota bacterium]